VAKPEPLRTRVSTKGQVILPKAIRTKLRWTPGTELEVESREDGVLLRAASLFAPTTIDDVFGALRYSGKPKTIAEMDAAVAEEARRRARD
jgi:AbrB family looped-hinge helix DNA binding protein